MITSPASEIWGTGRARVASLSARPASQALRRRRAPEYARRVFAESDAAARRWAVGAARSPGGGHHGPGRGWRPRTSKRLMPGSSGRSSVIQTMRASTSIRQRSPGVFSGIRPMATSAIRNHTWSWSPSGSSSAPNQRLCPLGSWVGSRGVRVRGQPGRVDHRRDALFVGRVARRSTERRHQLAGRRLGGRS